MYVVFHKIPSMNEKPTVMISPIQQDTKTHSIPIKTKARKCVLISWITAPINLCLAFAMADVIVPIIIRRDRSHIHKIYWQARPHVQLGGGKCPPWVFICYKCPPLAKPGGAIYAPPWLSHKSIADKITHQNWRIFHIRKYQPYIHLTHKL